MRKPVTRQMMANHLKGNHWKYKIQVCSLQEHFGNAKLGKTYLSKLERGFHWNSIQPWGENWPKNRLILPLHELVSTAKKCFDNQINVLIKTCKWESHRVLSSGKFSIAATWVAVRQWVKLEIRLTSECRCLGLCLHHCRSTRPGSNDPTYKQYQTDSTTLA